ncbi:LysR substrate-binding domain-containing protein [Nocardioides coralli]|uniref:LysR substrate-binding domain-containing protein n=1 Tax=Nocardioides coralli TaxID=2872154 RepID=UPI001CA3DC2D|nr:LysR substrate-binding domain-containing protein [Nocardioides coralli]QZY27644.1 LysR family transcriptional regulator [Nocardioides coralli]
MDGGLRLGFVTGTTPDKWARTWRDYRPEPLQLVPVTESEQEKLLREHGLDMCLVRLPVDREGLHLVRLYEEVAVVVVPRDHFVTAATEVELADLGDEQLVRPHASGWRPTAEQLDWPAMTEREAVEVVAGGNGIVILPMSVARLLHRKDVVARPVTDLAPTTVGLAWLVERDDETTQAFVGVVRGRTPRSSR